MHIYSLELMFTINPPNHSLPFFKTLENMNTPNMKITSMVILAILPSLAFCHPSALGLKKSNHIFMVQESESDLIESTCKNTPNYQLCISTLESDARSRGADVYMLGLIVVDAVKEKSSLAMETIEKMKSSNPNPEFIMPLIKCNILYSAVLKADIPEAIAGLTQGVPKFAEFGMDDAALEARMCESCFEGTNSSPLAAMNKDVYDLSLVAKSIIRMLL